LGIITTGVYLTTTLHMNNSDSLLSYPM